MPLNYNFAFKNSKLQQWERQSPSNLLTSDASLKKKLAYIYQIFIKNGELFYPPTFILISTLAIQIINIYPVNIINKLESKHIEYARTTQSLSNLKTRKDNMKKHLSNIKNLYSQSTPSYLFAFYLQNSVPQGVRMNDYFISDNGFNIRASSYGIEPLNELLTLVIESPIIKKSSVAVKKIGRKEEINNSSSSPSSTVVLEIYGKILRLTPEKRERLYEESLSHGLSRKILRLKSLEKLIRS